MKDLNKFYDKVYIISNQSSTEQARINKLVPLLLETEVPEIISKLQAVIDILKNLDYCRRNKFFGRYTDTKVMYKNQLADLFNAIERYRGLKKPEWQILAEMNGWRPPF